MVHGWHRSFTASGSAAGCHCRAGRRPIPSRIALDRHQPDAICIRGVVHGPGRPGRNGLNTAKADDPHQGGARQIQRSSSRYPAHCPTAPGLRPGWPLTSNSAGPARPPIRPVRWKSPPPPMDLWWPPGQSASPDSSNSLGWPRGWVAGVSAGGAIAGGWTAWTPPQPAASRAMANSPAVRTSQRPVLECDTTRVISPF